MADIRLHNINCMEFMKGVPDKAYDLAIVDPPFGIGNFVQDSGTIRGEAVKWNDDIPNNLYFHLLRKVSRNRIIFGANYFNQFEETGGAIVWVKNQPMPNFSKAVIASCSFHQKIELYEQTWTNYVNTRVTSHPCEMPVDIYKWILNKYAKPGDKILDTHGGSMSIAIACYDLGFDLDLCELDPDYFKGGQARLDAHIAKYAPASEIPVNKKGEIKLF